MRAPNRQALSTRIIPFALLALFSLAAWLAPGFLGAPSSFDSIVVIIWLAAMTLLLIDSLRRDRKRKRYLRTFYIDRNKRQVFNPAAGLIPYREGDDLLDIMTVTLVNTEGTSHIDPPGDFLPTMVVETDEFSYVHDATLRANAPIKQANDVTVYRWEGRIIDLASDREREFSSPFDLEDIFYARNSSYPAFDQSPIVSHA